MILVGLVLSWYLRPNIWLLPHAHELISAPRQVPPVWLHTAQWQKGNQQLTICAVAR